MMGGLQYDTTRIEAARRRKSSAQISLQTVRQKRKVDNALVALMHCFEPCSPCCHRTAVAFDFSDSCDFCGLITEIISLKDSEESLSCNQIRKQFSFQRSVVGYPIVLRLCVLPDHRQPIPFVVGRLALKKLLGDSRFKNLSNPGATAVHKDATSPFRKRAITDSGLPAWPQCSRLFVVDPTRCWTLQGALL